MLTEKIKLPSKRQLCVIAPFAVLYTLFIILADLEKAEGLSFWHNVGRILFFMAFWYAALLILCWLLSNRRVLAERISFLGHIPKLQRRQGKWYIFIIFFLCCFLCYLPYFLMYYPTWLSNDAVWQIQQILGWVPKSNHHPYFHTMIMKAFFMTGYWLFGTYTEAIAFYTFWQMTVMAMVFAFILYQLYKRGTRLLWLVLAVVFYAVLPANAMLTLCMGKDEFFVAALFFYTWTVAEYDREETFRPVACFMAGLLLCLLRSNGIFIFLGTTAALLVSDIWKKLYKREKLAKKDLRKDNTAKDKTCGNAFLRRKYIVIGSVFVCYLLYKGPVLHMMHVEEADTIEGLTMPTQHLLCAYLKGGELTEEETAMIEAVVPTENLSNYYHPYLFDPVKALIREEGNQQVIAEHKWEYFKLWLRVGLRNPLQYMVAEVRQTMGYWAYRVKDYQYIYGEYFMVDNPFGVTTQRKFFTYDQSLAMDRYLKGFQDLFNKVWSLGLTTWLMVFALVYAIYDRRSVMPFIPYIMLLITLFLATPVYNEFRYTYGMFIALPLLLGYSFGMRNGGLTEREDEADEKMA